MREENEGLFNIIKKSNVVMFTSLCIKNANFNETQLNFIITNYSRSF